MRVCSVFAAIGAMVLCLAAAVPAWARFKEGGTEAGAEGPKLGKSQVSRWRVGVIVRASGGACRGMSGYMAVPKDWPEQEVSIAEENVSPEAKVHYETVPGSDVRIMIVKIANLPSGQEAKALVTFEVRRSEILPPKDTDAYVVPDSKKLPRDVRPFLVPSPLIECHDPKIRAWPRRSARTSRRRGTTWKRFTIGCANTSRTKTRAACPRARWRR